MSYGDPRVPAVLQMWGGVECTVNRLGSRYRDQLQLNGHAQRLDDLERFAELGISALRYPVLWEHHAAHIRAVIDWRVTDARLERLRSLGIRPILGLLHHGSGPVDTSLIHDDFPDEFASFAGQVAQRYPWVDAYTPINEPLTTARFSGLYGHWYPHHGNDRSFLKALLNQCRATVLAMQRIRRINAAAELIQTEDLGKTHSVAELVYQARFENERRWLSFDLLTGQPIARRLGGRYLTRHGIRPDELRWFQDHACPPNVIGANYYVTSERFLDTNIGRYPVNAHGGNGRHRYADVEACRYRPEGMDGLRVLLPELWARYRLPIAITEVHLGGPREAQIRWLLDAWQTAQELRTSGVDLRAITTWALLGSFDWCSLLTRDEGYYESGAFDVRGPSPRPTAIAQVVRSLAKQQDFAHPAIPTAGWWQPGSREMLSSATVSAATSRRVPILIAGGRGTLGQAFYEACCARDIACVVLSRPDLDITSREEIDAALERIRPWVLINTAGYVRVDEAEHDVDRCELANTRGPTLLAQACERFGIPLLTFSSDLVFDGNARLPYVEGHPVAPLSAYGRTKAEAERQVLAICPQALMIRTSAFFGPQDDYNFLTTTLRALQRGESVIAATDWTVSPTYVPEMAHVCLDLLIDGEHGLWHLANHGEITWHDFAREAATRTGFSPDLVVGKPLHELSYLAPRPCYSVLGSERAQLLTSLDRSLDCYCEAWRYRQAQSVVGSRA